MASTQARAMAAAGYWVLQVDLLGCGDSSGDFGDASWAGWIEDVVSACVWLRKQTDAQLWLWGLRTGCLLATEAAKQLDRSSRLLLWQPVFSGKQFLQQFLRMKVAGEMLAGESRGLMDRMREDLAQGKSVEVGGYALSPGLAKGMELVELSLPETATQVEWIEVSGKMDGGLSPVAAMRLEKWNSQGHAARGAVVCGPSFWQTVEIEECPALVDASLAAMVEAGQP